MGSGTYIDQRQSIVPTERQTDRRRVVARVQLALNVADLDKAVDFYSRLFRTPPAKLRPGYANFAVADPPLKLVLIESAATPGTLNHLGVEVAGLDDLAAAKQRL